jgi:hypothetical protein
MKVLGTSVLVFEAIVVALFIPVAFFTGTVTDGATAAWLGGALAVVCLLGAGMVTRRGGIAVGWAIQVAVVACGFVVPLMFGLGGIFAALWWAAVHFGRKADAASSTREG